MRRTTQLAPDGGSEYRRQLECWCDPRPQWPDNLPPFARAAYRLSGDYALGPAKADLVEIQIGVVRTDVMEDASDSATNAVIEPLCCRATSNAGIVAVVESMN